ncbi:MAG: NACHT domain-containing protein [Chloroflexi bacterium]|nr:NACHT domain-containing protein [Chloroflexota bacterium]
MYPRIVLVGSPGAGKTTALHRIALNAAHSKLTNPRTSPLPFLLYLPSWRNEQSFSEFIKSQWPFGDDPFQLFSTGDVIVLFDGLNEMGARASEKISSLRKWLHAEKTMEIEIDVNSVQQQVLRRLMQSDHWREDLAPQRTIITCRVDDYGGAF